MLSSWSSLSPFFLPWTSIPQRMRWKTSSAMRIQKQPSKAVLFPYTLLSAILLMLIWLLKIPRIHWSLQLRQRWIWLRILPPRIRFLLQSLFTMQAIVLHLVLKKKRTLLQSLSPWRQSKQSSQAMLLRLTWKKKSPLRLCPIISISTQMIRPLLLKQSSNRRFLLRWLMLSANNNLWMQIRKRK